MELAASAGDAFQATYLQNYHSTNNNNNINRKSRISSRPLSSFGNKVNNISNKLSYVERVVLEIIDTERVYVQDLRAIVEDYLGGIIDQQELPMKPEQVSALFGNIEDIYELNSELLQDLDNYSDDPVAVANCFVAKSQDFDIYTQYCNNYPNSVATLTECMRNKVLAKFFREKQELLKQPLPLGAYLLKPVQRILKYHLLLQEIAKHFDVNKKGYDIVEEAIETMTGVAWYINDMKRKHEHAVRQQEIQSLLLNWKGIDLTAYGELVLEGTFRVQRARSERTFFLFDKALLITKKRGDHFVYKTHIPCASLMLIESTRESLCFTLAHYKNGKQQHNVQAKTAEEKRLWTHHIKKLILENHHAIIPQKAKEAILEMDAIYPGRYKYSPERVKKAMSTIDPLITQRSGRRQSGKNEVFPASYNGAFLVTVISNPLDWQLTSSGSNVAGAGSCPMRAVYRAYEVKGCYKDGAPFQHLVSMEFSDSEEEDIYVAIESQEDYSEYLIKLWYFSPEVDYPISGLSKNTVIPTSDSASLVDKRLDQISKHFSMHADSEGALPEYEDILRPSNGILTLNLEQPQTEGVQKQPTSTVPNKELGEEFSASEDEEDIKLGDDAEVADSASSLLAVIHCWQYKAKTLLDTLGSSVNKDLLHHETSKGFKRQNSQFSGTPEKRRSVEVTAFNLEVDDEVGKDHSGAEQFYIAEMVGTAEIPLEAHVDPSEDNPLVEKDGENASDIHNPLDNGLNGNMDEVKAFSSEEDEEEVTEHEVPSILPPSVLDQASVIAERFVNNISRRNSLALEDGKGIECVTPKLTNRSSSLINLESSDKSLVYQNGTSEFMDSLNFISDDEPNKGLTLKKNSSVENVYGEMERTPCKRRESILSIQDRQLIDKIKTYYDKADNNDASFSIKRRESFTYIPAGLVRNSVFKINSLPRDDGGNQSNFIRHRVDSSSSNADTRNGRQASWLDSSSYGKKRDAEDGRQASWLDSSSYGKKRDAEEFTNCSHRSASPLKKQIPGQPVPVADDEFKSPSKMVKVWEEMEKHTNWNSKNDQEEGIYNKVSPVTHQLKPGRAVESHEPLIIIEESDLSTITEESQPPTPQSTPPKQVTFSPSNMGRQDQGYKTPVTLDATFMHLANCMDGELTEKMKNKVYQLARQYSQRIKCKSAPHRYLRELEEDMRRSSLPSVQEEKHEEKCKMKPVLSLPTNDNFVVQDHSSTPTSAHFNDKSPKHLLFYDSPQSSPVKSDCKSPLSPVNAETFHWPDVRELRSRYASTVGTNKSIPVNRSLSMPEAMTECNADIPSNMSNVAMKHSSSITEEANSLGKVPSDTLNRNGRPQAVTNSNDFWKAADDYYISAEAPLENNKKVIIMEKFPTTLCEIEKDDTYVHIRSPTTREKISIKAVIERCKAYQDSDEYKTRDEFLESNDSKESAYEKSKPEGKPTTKSIDATQPSKVRDLREKFQNSSSIKQ
ncbi:pleckstrin homology domain-containing family G member 3 [Gastrophryne carolinensis]